MNQKTYKDGGIINSDNHVYVVRQADKKLQELLKKKEYCYVLNAKQMGKSSLATKAIKELKKDGIYSVLFTLEDVSEKKDEKNWYTSFVRQLIPQIMTEINITDFDWENYYKDSLADNPDPVAALSSLLQKIIEIIQKDIIIFIDEIDKMRHVEFEIDSFFNKIRSLYSKRTNPSSWANHITFCLIGTATPDFFIKDQYTSFNIAERIELSKLKWEDAKAPLLAAGLQTEFKKNAESILQRVFYWTNGQPYLTQKLCKLLVGSRDEESKIILLENEIESNIQLFVDNCVDEKIIKNWRIYDEHIRYIADQINSVALLETYRKILESKDKKILANDDISKIELELRLSGLVIRTQDEGEYYLKAFNRIYEEALNLSWVEKKLEDKKRYWPKFKAWQAAKKEPEEKKQQTQLYLLYGQELQKSLKFRDSQVFPLEPEENDFLRDSQKFWSLIQRNIPQNKIEPGYNYELIITEMNNVTGGIEFFNNFILDILRRKKSVEAETVAEAVDKLKKAKEDYLDQVKTLQDDIQLLFLDDKDPTIDPFWLLLSYEEILQRREVEFNESPEHQKLETMCLIFKKDNKLKILNKLYRQIFDEDWIKETLKSLASRPYANSFIAWKHSSEDKSHLLQKDDLDIVLTWLQNNEISKELEIKFIITNLVREMWQSATEEEKSQAVEIITQFQPQLKGKTNHLYGFIQKVLEHTASDRDLLENLLKKACEQENRPTEEQEEWIKQQLRLLKPNQISQEILAWIQSYEKAIVSRNFQFSKKMIDRAFCELVEQLAEKFYFSEYTDPQDRDPDTIVKSCIDHLSDNLIKAGIWNESERPIINKIEDCGEKVWMVKVSNCSYKEECQWALGKTEFIENNQYRCQRLGCCVGALKKWSKEVLTDNPKKKLDYSMETVMDENERCQGFIFIDENGMRQSILQKYPTKFPAQ